MLSASVACWRESILPLFEGNSISAIPSVAGDKYDQIITKSSSSWQREAFALLAGYFSRETRQEFLLKSTSENWDLNGFSAVPFVDVSVCRDGRLTHSLYGGALFTRTSYNQCELAFIWIHPFWRGHLRSHWGHLESVMGRGFLVSHPRTPVMQAFLNSIGYQDYATCQWV